MLNGFFMFCEFTFLVRPPPIRVWRERRRLTVSALADQAGISQAYLSQIESGKREDKASVLPRYPEHWVWLWRIWWCHEAASDHARR